MSEAFFEQLDRQLDRAARAFLATPACVGPWSPSAQHGGPPSALLVRQAEIQATTEAGPAADDLVAHRVAVEFLGPVPVGEVEVTSRVVRAGRSVVLVEGRLSANGRACLQARTWLVRRPAQASTPVVAGDDPAGPGPDGLPSDESWTFPYARHLEWRPVSTGGFGPHDAGPARVWARPRIPLVAPVRGRGPGEEPGAEVMSGLQRAALVGDSGSGVSSVLSWDEWSFVNIDLDIHLLRQVRGDWLLLDATTRTGPDGTGLATTTFRDSGGVVGTGSQTLVIAPRA